MIVFIALIMRDYTRCPAWFLAIGRAVGLLTKEQNSAFASIEGSVEAVLSEPRLTPVIPQHG